MVKALLEDDLNADLLTNFLDFYQLREDEHSSSRKEKEIG